ncbi:pirin family protein [Parahaliea sp. F7430]|uniref:Pirin family protein n=1 Tax=Sediminihaliea albiluteola TaxID=2758564 RepID=A0A7W2TW35_9GAMM|nr:pirin family protein [Sediminihaliea albiluteola]MBA6412934.1 pirin family protein [Sediminihaliea albiluteola]
MSRKLFQIYQAQPSRDGAGVKINRIAGKEMNRVLDPFLMIDEINADSAADYIGGFPEHPHRGFETITYMKAGRMRHRDHMGNEGVIEPGDVQWMTAGRGVLHSEMPEQEEGLMHGFQLWLNLPAKDKLKPAAYRDIRAAEIASYRDDNGSEVRVIAGEVGIDGQRLKGCLPAMPTRPLLLDVSVAAGEEFSLSLGDYERVLVFVYAGGSTELSSKQLAVYGKGDKLSLQAGPQGLGALVLSGEPLREPIAQYGPFVMNQPEEIEQAIRDFQAGTLLSPA